jgi:hypothetical protein
LLRELVEPAHTLTEPDIAGGFAFIVTLFVAEHPSLLVNDTVATPAPIPEITPTLLIVAIVDGELLQTPALTSVTVAVPPTHIAIGVAGSIGAGFALTPIVVVAVQEPTAYVIGAPPTPMPVTTPLLDPTVATGVKPLVHVPPGTEPLSIMVVPKHTVEGPVIGPTEAVTVTTVNTVQEDAV